jgi:type III pantothenate kinase
MIIKQLHCTHINEVEAEVIMIIAADLGNTALTLGVYDNKRLIHYFYTPTDRAKTTIDYEVVLLSFAHRHHIGKDQIKGIILSSVVPPMMMTIRNSLINVFNAPMMILTKGVKTGLPINIEHPNELGSDLVAVSVGGLVKHGKPLIIVDVGTATKMMFVDKSGVFQGVSIMPGIVTSVNALIKSTAQLIEISLEKPRKIIGKNTPDSMNSGAIYGMASMISCLATKMEKEIGYQCTKVLTGGYVDYIKSELTPQFIVDKTLVLDGLFHIYNLNNEK